MSADVWKNSPAIAKTHGDMCLTALMDGVATGFEGASTFGQPPTKRFALHEESPWENS
jgi:hypothetical protein